MRAPLRACTLALRALCDRRLVVARADRMLANARRAALLHQCRPGARRRAVWIGFLIVAGVFVRVRRHLRADLAESEEKARVLRKLWAYPLIFVVLWAASTADKVCFDIWGRSPQWLLWLHVVSASLQGFLNALVFGTVHFGADKVVREWLRRKGVCACCWPRDAAAAPQVSMPRGRRSTKVLWQATSGGAGGFDGGQPLLA